MRTEPFTLTTRSPSRPAAEPTVEQLLDFEATTPDHSGWKDEAIRVELGLKPARYYVLLHRAATSPRGIAHDPLTSRRVRQRRTAHDRRMPR